MPVLDISRLIANRVDAIRAFHSEFNVPRAELDVSGGIDSAVMAGLLVKALGPENVTFVHTNINTSSDQSMRAHQLITALGGKLVNGNFTNVYDDIVTIAINSLVTAGYEHEAILERIKRDPTVLGSIRSTLRAPLGRAYNRLTGGGIRHGTGNECEDRFLRFYQKGGDGEVDTNPIAMLSKSEVYQLAFGLGNDFGCDARIEFRKTIDATPTPDLLGTGVAQSDEDELLALTGAPFTYGRVDSVTGAIISIGTIERVSRFLDMYQASYNRNILFGCAEPDWRLLQWLANESGCFDGIDPEIINKLLRAARRVESNTRHKMNLACPTLGTRIDLRSAGILTDDLKWRP